MLELKAFLVDENTMYAATSADEAVRLFAEDTGAECIDDYPRELTDAELDEQHEEFDEDEHPTGEFTCARKWLDEMTDSGFMAGSLS